MRPRLGSKIAVAGVLALLACAAPAMADSGTSTNWSGFVAHKDGTSFRRVSGVWQQPYARCTAGSDSYSMIWVGLGGFGSSALEQIGTEIECTASGQLLSNAWFELVPSASAAIPMTVRPGDLMTASVTVAGHRVRLTITDRTSGHSFSRALSAGPIDVSSAEWIVERPASCLRCGLLQLADFGSVSFANAAARTVGGRSGSISSGSWTATRLTLVPAGLSSGSAPKAIPSPLFSGGGSFAVSYSRPATVAARS